MRSSETSSSSTSDSFPSISTPTSHPSSSRTNTSAVSARGENIVCRFCGSGNSRPLKPFTHNPIEVGLCLKAEDFERLKNWETAEEEQQTEKWKQNLGRIDELEYEGSEVIKRRHDVVREQEILERMEGNFREEEDFLNKALEIELGRDTREKGREKENEKIEDFCTMYLVPKIDGTMTVGRKRFGEKKVNGGVQGPFRLPCHLVPYHKSGAGEPTIPDRFKRVKGVWLCLNETRLKDWDSLRQASLSGKVVECEFINISGSLCIPLQLRLLTGLAPRVTILGRPGPSELEMERRCEVRLCNDSGEEGEKEERLSTWSRRAGTSWKSSKVATRLKLDGLFDVRKEKKTGGLDRNPVVGTQGRPRALEMSAELIREPTEQFGEQCEQVRSLLQTD
jgi:hypothetical protein